MIRGSERKGRKSRDPARVVLAVKAVAGMGTLIQQKAQMPPDEKKVELSDLGTKCLRDR